MTWIILALIALWAGYSMWQRYTADLLWGYRPLALLLPAWLAIVLAGAWWRSRRGRPIAWRWLGLSTLSGVLLAVGFPDIMPVPFLLFIAWVPLLIVEQEVSAGDERPAWRFLRYAYHTLVVWNIIATYWVANSALVAGIFAIWVNSLLMLAPLLLFHLTRRVTPRLGYAALVVYWLSFEYIHLNWELTWPWLTLGNGFAEYPSWVQWYDVTGVFGGSLWIWLANILFLGLYQRYKAGENLRPRLIGIATLILPPLLLSLYQYYTYEEKGDTATVVVVQPNFEPHYEKFDLPESDQLPRYLSLTLEAMNDSVDYVVYPETSFGYMEEREVANYDAIRAVVEQLRPYPNVKLVTGINAYRDFGPGETLSRAARQRQEGSRRIDYEVLNAAAQIDLATGEVQTYRKSKLVPGPEIFPLSSYLFFLEPMIEQLDGTTAGLGIQAERSVFSSATASIAPVICYESVFGEYFTGYIRAGAQAAFIMTNDGWWDNTAGHRQHLYYASLRAIETRRDIARSANTGISAFLNQRGDIRMATDYNEPIAIRDEIRLNDQVTFYVRWGDLIARIALFCSIFLLLNTFVKGRIKKSKMAAP